MTHSTKTAGKKYCSQSNNRTAPNKLNNLFSFHKHNFRLDTPDFPAFRARLAALGRRTTQTFRQTSLGQLQQHLRDFLPHPLLAAETAGPNSRNRVFSLRLTFECFLWQMLQPRTSCREVVRQVQALFRLHGKGPVDGGDSAYVQGHQPLSSREPASRRSPRLFKLVSPQPGAGGGETAPACSIRKCRAMPKLLVINRFVVNANQRRRIETGFI